MLSETIRTCRYFKNKQHCPYDKIGCMFGHLDADPAIETSDDVIKDFIDNKEETEDEIHIEEPIFEAHDVENHQDIEYIEID